MKYPFLAAVVVLSTLAATGSADVFNMGAGLTSIELVPVGNAGNIGDDAEMMEDGTSGYGRVDYDYQIGTYEVTGAQYTEFLNAVAATDPYGLWTPNWTTDTSCQIIRSGSDGTYTYSVAADYANRPANFISWADAARFCNWLANGQPTGAPSAATTEDGSYILNGATTDEVLMTVMRRPDATYVMPSENEWYKAAYYDGVSDVYYDYPTGTNDIPDNDLVSPDPGNNANFYYWTGFQDDFTLGAPYWTTEVGEFENSPSPCGTFDMGGNVWEWNETVTNPIWRGGKGGEAKDDRGFMNAAAYRSGGTPTAEWRSLGFRIALAPETITDLDGDSHVGAGDIDVLRDNLGNGDYDFDGDGDADEDDLIYMIENLVAWDSDGDGEPDGYGTYRGDVNLDGEVNGTDLSVMNANFGQTVGYAGGNTNTDSVVNGTDLSILAGTFGNVATAAIPEPTTVLLLLAGMGALLKRRRG